MYWLLSLRDWNLFTAGLYMAENCVVLARKQLKSYKTRPAKQELPPNEKFARQRRKSAAVAQISNEEGGAVNSNSLSLPLFLLYNRRADTSAAEQLRCLFHSGCNFHSKGASAFTAPASDAFRSCVCESFVMLHHTFGNTYLCGRQIIEFIDQSDIDVGRTWFTMAAIGTLAGIGV